MKTKLMAPALAPSANRPGIGVPSLLAKLGDETLQDGEHCTLPVTTPPTGMLGSTLSDTYGAATAPAGLVETSSAQAMSQAPRKVARRRNAVRREWVIADRISTNHAKLRAHWRERWPAHLRERNGCGFAPQVSARSAKPRLCLLVPSAD